jgi:hypothetical protein
MPDAPLRLYVVSTTYARETGLRHDIAGLTFVILARSGAEARGEAHMAGEARFPGYTIQGRVSVSAVDDDSIRAAARELGMRDG